MTSFSFVGPFEGLKGTWDGSGVGGSTPGMSGVPGPDSSLGSGPIEKK